MAEARPIVSPYVMTFGDNFGNDIRITVTFDATTRVLSGITVFRDPDCQWHRILIGVGDDGVPDNSTRTFDVPAGTTVLTNQQMNAVRNNGMRTIEEFDSFQITAGI